MRELINKPVRGQPIRATTEARKATLIQRNVNRGLGANMPGIAMGPIDMVGIPEQASIKRVLALTDIIPDGPPQDRIGPAIVMALVPAEYDEAGNLTQDAVWEATDTIVLLTDPNGLPIWRNEEVLALVHPGSGNFNAARGAPIVDIIRIDGAAGDDGLMPGTVLELYQTVNLDDTVTYELVEVRACWVLDATTATIT